MGVLNFRNVLLLSFNHFLASWCFWAPTFLNVFKNLVWLDDQFRYICCFFIIHFPQSFMHLKIPGDWFVSYGGLMQMDLNANE